MIDYEKYGLQEALRHENSMDRRHAEWIKGTLSLLKPQHAIEIGCWAGVSTLAILESGVPDTHLIDISIQDTVRAMAADYGATIHEGCSQDVLPRLGDIWKDVAVLIDGEHGYDAVHAEWNLIRTNTRPRVVIVHDVTSTHIGIGGHEGPCWLWHELQRDGYFCMVDAVRRDGEYTQRGLAIAVNTQSDYFDVYRAYQRATA